MLLAALIWGCSFVAQRLSLETMGPFGFTGLRFLLGALVVALLGTGLKFSARGPSTERAKSPSAWGVSALLGLVVAVSIATQQVGLRYTKVANAGFISSMYVVIVPLISVLKGQRLRAGIVLGALCAAVGLYYLSGERLRLGFGDTLELIGALAISLQILLLAAAIQRHEPLRVAALQNLVCGLICLAIAAVTEGIRLAEIQRSAWTLFYTGAISVGIGYAIQAVAQKDAQPAHAAIIFSMEGVFAALAGWIVIGETLSWHAIGGCALVVVGCLFSQLTVSRA